MARTYYRGPDCLVTETHFVHLLAGGDRAFLVSDLLEVGTTRRRGPNYVPVVVAVSVVVLGGAIVSVFMPHPWVWVTAGMVAVAALVVGRSVLNRHPLTYALQASHRGVPVELYTSTEAQRFAQVCRALQRSLEHHRGRR